MCDTLVACGEATADGTVILAKNSDRQPNEAHVLVSIPRTQHKPGTTVKCTYVEIPQVPETYQVAPDLSTYWLTGTSATCTSIFKPVYLGSVDLPSLGPEPTGDYDPESLWWTHERLHRSVIRDYPTRLPLYRQDRDALEAQFISEAATILQQYRGLSGSERSQTLAAFSASCFERAAEATACWTETVTRTPVHQRPPRLFSRAWDILDKQAGFQDSRNRQGIG